MMAPGTKPEQQREVPLGDRLVNDEFADMMDILDNVDLPNVDPWQVPDQEIITVGNVNVHDQSFEDAFVSSSDNQAENQAKYEHNTEYLAYLEGKLNKIEVRRRNTHKVTARDVLNSLKDAKETQLNWNMQQGESSTDGDTVYSEGNGSSSYPLTKELMRKMFPEQQALNESELLHLLEHDIIENNFRQFHMGTEKQ